MSHCIPNGSILTTVDELIELTSWAFSAVVVDRDSTPWIVYQAEDGDDWAVTAECPDEGIPARTQFELLCRRGPLRVVFNGDTSPATWPGIEAQQGSPA